jgi:hypothetical protein
MKIILYIMILAFTNLSHAMSLVTIDLSPSYIKAINSKDQISISSGKGKGVHFSIVLTSNKNKANAVRIFEQDKSPTESTATKQPFTVEILKLEF